MRNYSTTQHRRTRSSGNPNNAQHGKRKVRSFTKPAYYTLLAATGMLLLSSCATSLDYEMTVHSENEVEISAEVTYAKNGMSKQDILELRSYAEPPTEESGITITESETEDAWIWSYDTEKMTVEEYNDKFTAVDIRKDGNLIRASIPYEVESGVSSGGSYTIVMPGKVTKAEGATVDGNKATFTQGDSDRTMYVESKAGSNGLMIAGVVVAVVIGAGAAGYFTYTARARRE